MSKIFLTPRFAAIALLGAGPAALLGLIGVPVLAALGGWAALCGLAAAADIALTPSPRQVEVSRRGPSAALRDEPVQMLIGLRNVGTRAIRGAVQDTWPKHALLRASAGHPPGSAPASSSPSPWIPVVAPPGEPLSIPFALAPRRRGTLRSGFIAVRARGPLGLAGRETRHPLPATLAVSWRPRRGARAGASVQPSGPGLAAEQLRAIDEANGTTLARALHELRFFAGLYGGGPARPGAAAAPCPAWRAAGPARIAAGTSGRSSSTSPTSSPARSRGPSSSSASSSRGTPRPSRSSPRSSPRTTTAIS
jgi:hypothetical protein